MSSQALALDGTTYDRVEIVAQEGHKPGGEIQVLTTVGLNVADDPLRWQVSLVVEVKGDQTPIPPYAIRVSGHGLFRVNEITTMPDTARVVGIAGASILYSGMREIVLLLTARGPHGAFMLPTMNFSGLSWSPSEKPSTKSSGRVERKRTKSVKPAKLKAD